MRNLALALLGAALLVASVLFVTTPAWAAEEAPIAVISPDIGEPYRTVFNEIIAGVEGKLGARVTDYPVRSDTDIGFLKSSLFSQNTKVVIALGRQGMKMAAALDADIKTVIGGVLTVPEDEARAQPVISLSPDPAVLFARMKMLMPTVKRVFVVYDPGINDWLIRLAKEAAHAQGMELVAHEAQDIRSAVKYYQEFFSTANSRSDALWLPQDSTTVEESAVLPLVLRESWNQEIAVFSSNSSHVRRGVLFSFYPDNVALGRGLADLARGILISGAYGRRGMIPLRDMQSAINLRTAKHLSLNTARHQGFNISIPEQ